MKVMIGEKTYYVNEQDFIDVARKKMISVSEQKIQLPYGPTIDLSSKSLLSVALRQVLVFIVPVLDWTAKRIGIQLPKRNKQHDPIIQYVINSYWQIVEETLKDGTLILETDIDQITGFDYDKAKPNVLFGLFT